MCRRSWLEDTLASITLWYVVLRAHCLLPSFRIYVDSRGGRYSVMISATEGPVGGGSLTTNYPGVSGANSPFFWCPHKQSIRGAQSAPPWHQLPGVCGANGASYYMADSTKRLGFLAPRGPWLPLALVLWSPRAPWEPFKLLIFISERRRKVPNI